MQWFELIYELKSEVWVRILSFHFQILDTQKPHQILGVDIIRWRDGAADDELIVPVIEVEFGETKSDLKPAANLNDPLTVGILRIEPPGESGWLDSTGEIKQRLNLASVYECKWGESTLRFMLYTFSFPF